MKDQPAFPADEPLQPAPGCQCDVCRQLRRDTAAAAIVTLIETTRRTFGQDDKTTAKGQPDASESRNARPAQFEETAP